MGVVTGLTSGLAILSSSELCDVFIAIVIVQRATKILVKIGSARCYIDFNSWHALELFYCCTYLGGGGGVSKVRKVRNMISR